MSRLSDEGVTEVGKWRSGCLTLGVLDDKNQQGFFPFFAPAVNGFLTFLTLEILSRVMCSVSQMHFFVPSLTSFKEGVEHSVQKA